MVIKHRQVKDVMKKQNELPLCKEGDMIMDQLTELTSKGCGCLLVVDDEYHLIGTFTDGDLRRTLKSSGTAIFNLTVGEMCNRFVDIYFLYFTTSEWTIFLSSFGQQ
jgi:arabinose-5-phosphate isomerase